MADKQHIIPEIPKMTEFKEERLRMGNRPSKTVQEINYEIK